MKIRQLITAEYAVNECIAQKPVAELAKAIGKSAPFLYKTADAMQAHQITVRDALVLDPLVHADTGAAPFRELFIRNILGADQKPARGNLRDLMLSIQSELGELAGQVRKATDIESPGGADFTATERAALMIELEGIQSVLNQVFHVVYTAPNAGGENAK